MHREVNKTITSPQKAIKAFCKSCSGDSIHEVKRCPSLDCPLYAFRLGENPYRTKKTLTEEQRELYTKRLEKARLTKRQKQIDSLSQNKNEQTYTEVFEHE